MISMHYSHCIIVILVLKEILSGSIKHLFVIYAFKA